MDFKVAGDDQGITTFQLDIKCEGLTLETMERALAQAKEGRLHILSEMGKVIAEPRSELPATVPKMRTFSIPYESIGKIIGPGGKQIRATIEDFELENMDVKDDGTIQVSSFDSSKLKEVEEFCKLLIEGKGGRSGGGREKPERPKYVGPDAEEGKNYMGKITGIHQFGVFLEILPGAEDGSTPGLEGLCHVSELALERVRNCEAYVRSMNVEQLEVKCLGLNEKGRLQLSRKAVLEEKAKNRKGGPRRSRSPRKDTKTNSKPKVSMPDEEFDVIVKAIESATDV